MNLLRINKSLLIFSLVGIISTSLIITPNISHEPIDQPKMLTLTLFAFPLLAIIISNLTKFRASHSINYLFGFLLILFIIDLLLVLIVSHEPLSEQFFGIYGRNTGLLTYASLSIFAFATSLIASVENLRTFSKVLFGLGLISLGYSALQTFGLDPYKWENPYNPIIGFLGNPDFESAFLGIFGSALFAFLINAKLKRFQKLAIFIVSIFILIIIFRSIAQQGLVVYATGVLVTLFFFIAKLKGKARKYLLTGLISSSALGAILIILGYLNSGPLSSFLYKVSVRQRVYYWSAAKKVMFEHPFFGTGLDSFGNWYLQYRSKAAIKNSEFIQTNVAHNVFLDFGANGGIPLFLINISLVILTILSIVRYTRTNKKPDWAYIAIVSAWIGYEVQCLISVNQIGLALWGWTLSGLLIGAERLQSRDILSQTTNRTDRAKKAIATNVTLSACVGLLVGCFIIIPYFYSDSLLRSAQASGSANNVVSAALHKPEDSYRTFQAAVLLAKNNLPNEELKLLNHIVARNPRFYNAWILKLELAKKGSDEWNQILKQILLLNPGFKTP